MLHGRGSHEIVLANTAVLVHLLQRLIDAKLLTRRSQRTCEQSEAGD